MFAKDKEPDKREAIKIEMLKTDEQIPLKTIFKCLFPSSSIHLERKNCISPSST